MTKKTKSKGKRKNIIWLIPENETRESHTYHYSLVKTKSIAGNMKLRKYNPVKRVHEMFKEVKAPSASK